jgi:hypothetical protein
MLISFGYDISLRLEVETAVLFCLRVHPSRREDIVSGENFQIEPQSPFEQYLDGFGNICGRVHCKRGIIRFVNQGVIRDSGQLDAYEPKSAQDEIFNLPQETLVYLLPSRYCEVDSELAAFAWANFSTAPLGWSRVQAFRSIFSRPLKTTGGTTSYAALAHPRVIFASQRPPGNAGGTHTGPDSRAAAR